MVLLTTIEGFHPHLPVKLITMFTIADRLLIPH